MRLLRDCVAQDETTVLSLELDGTPASRLVIQPGLPDAAVSGTQNDHLCFLRPPPL